MTQESTMEPERVVRPSYTKIDKKLHKAVAKLEKDIGKITSKIPTKILVICNAGHMTGLTHECVIEAFSPFGDVENVTFVPGKSFSFVSLSSEKSAELVANEFSGQKSLTDSTNPIYISFVNEIPDIFKTDESFESCELPEGLEIISEFITEDEESEIVRNLSWNTDNSGNLKHRQVLHFGKEFVYGSNTISANNSIQPLPENWCSILEKSAYKGSKRKPDQCTVNRYLPGQGIPPHVDNHECCDDTIVSFSLL